MLEELPDIGGLSESFRYDLLRSVCTKSFFRFVQEFWSVVIKQKPVWNWHIPYLCQKLEHMFDNVVNGRPKEHDLIINLPPSSSKSSICSILFPAWVWIRMPECRFITASFSLDLAEGFARQSKMLMQSDLYKRCFGEFKFFPEKVGHYMNQFKGERIVCTTGTSPTGRHAHFILIDDPVDPLDTDRANSIIAVNHWMSKVIRSRTVDARISPFMLIMQRLSVDDPTGDWLAKLEHATDTNTTKVFHIVLPASIEKGQKVKPAGLRRYYKDGLFDPVRLSYRVLAEKKMWMSVTDYSAQYDQNPLPREGLMFKVQNIIIRPKDELDPIIQKVRYWDKAGTASKDACYTVGALMGRTASGKFVIMDIVRGQWDASKREAMIAATARADGPKVLIGIEQEPGPIYVEELIAMGDGSQRPLGDIMVGDFVINKDGNATMVYDVIEKGTLPCRRISTMDGKSLYISPDHMLITPNGDVAVSDLKMGTPIYVDRDGEIVEDAIENTGERMPLANLPCRCLTVRDGASFIANGVVVHNCSGIDSFQLSLQRLAGFSVYADRASQNKVSRAEPLAIQVDNFNVFMLPGSWNQVFLQEIGKFPADPIKDQVDAVCGAFRMLCGTGARTAGAL